MLVHTLNPAFCQDGRRDPEIRATAVPTRILHFLRIVCREGPVLFPEVVQLQLESASPTRLVSLPLYLHGQRDLVLPNPELFKPLRSTVMHSYCLLGLPSRVEIPGVALFPFLFIFVDFIPPDGVLGDSLKSPIIF